MSGSGDGDPSWGVGGGGLPWSLGETRLQGNCGIRSTDWSRLCGRMCEVRFCECADGLTEPSGSGRSTGGHSDSRWTSEASARQMGQVRFAWRRRETIKRLTNTQIHPIADEWRGQADKFNFSENGRLCLDGGKERTCFYKSPT